MLEVQCLCTCLHVSTGAGTLICTPCDTHAHAACFGYKALRWACLRASTLCAACLLALITTDMPLWQAFLRGFSELIPLCQWSDCYFLAAVLSAPQLAAATTHCSVVLAGVCSCEQKPERPLCQRRKGCSTTGAGTTGWGFRGQQGLDPGVKQPQEVERGPHQPRGSDRRS